MKKYFYGVLLVVTTLFVAVLVSCDKETTIEKQQNIQESKSILTMEPTYSINEIQSIVNDLKSAEKAAPGWWDKVKKWFKKHTGTHLFDNCTGSNPCGPCPGLCLYLGVVDGTPTDFDYPTQDDYSNALRVFGLFLIQNEKTNEEAIMFVFNKDVEDFTMDNYFYIERDIYASKSITNELGKNSIMFVKGKYNIVYDETTKYYYALVKTILK